MFALSPSDAIVAAVSTMGTTNGIFRFIITSDTQIMAKSEGDSEREARRLFAPVLLCGTNIHDATFQPQVAGVQIGRGKVIDKDLTMFFCNACSVFFVIGRTKGRK